MLKHVTFLGAAAVSLSVATGAFAQDVTADTVVAKVGDTEITVGELIIARSMLPPQYAQFPDDILFTGLIDQLVQQQLLADVVEDTPPSVRYTIENERRSLLAAQVITDIAETSITPELLQEAYQERFADAPEIPEFRAAHVLVETEEEANAAKAQLDAGEPFAEVASAVSLDVTSANGGDLGWFGEGAMVTEFENAVLALEVGGVSDPFETQFGWHIVTLLDQRARPTPPFEQVVQQLTAELQEAAVMAYLDELSAATTVERPEEGAFDPSVINQVELLD
ncbi:peptidylprolyl isomerase [Yoonia vestfoldensis]|uniref:peptidylprolyl isomerase n=1 Tax=Yoonia vestfoldensis TaxID=245188 RepID=UPI00036E9B50|nr:peptidylprolyl isomerase [Yoonia vestfoldensis]